MDKQKYYITTAIAYTSGKPHIGNTYEIVLADAIARYKRQEGYDLTTKSDDPCADGDDQRSSKSDRRTSCIR